MKTIHPKLMTIACLVLAVLLAGRILGAPGAVSAGEVQAQDNTAKWKALAPEEKERLRQTYRLWKDLSNDEQQKILSNYKKFKSFSSDEQHRILQNHKHFMRLDSAQRKVVMERYKKWMNMSPEQQELLRKRYQMLIDMHPEEQTKFYENYETWKRLTSDQKQDLLGTWNSLTLSRREALASKYQQAFSAERIEEVKRVLKKIRKEQLERGRDKTNTNKGTGQNTR